MNPVPGVDSALLIGRAKLDILARLLGLGISGSTWFGLRLGSGPKDRRETPDVLSRGTCLFVPEMLLRRFEGVSPTLIDEAVDPVVRFLLRIVTDEGTLGVALGDERGGVLTGPGGSFERADCTRASKRCIWAVSVRRLLSVLEGPDFCDIDRGGLDGAVGRSFRAAGVRIAPVVTTRVARVAEVDAGNCRGFGVMLQSAEGRRDFLCAAGVFAKFILSLDTDDMSEIVGDGGSWISERVSAVDSDLVSGGVVIMGELAVECGEFSKLGDSGIDRSVEMVDRWRDSCFLILSCRISASILRSDSSSLSRCASTRNCSLSCSPILISSSSMTARSMATLYFDSRSSSDEVVLRAWRSKSSLATSMSRSLRWSDLFVSRRVVISFSRMPCAAFASDLDSLCFLFHSSTS